MATHVRRTLSAVELDRAELENKKAEAELVREKESWLCCSGSQCSQQAVRFGVSVGAAFVLMGFSVAKLSQSGAPDPLFVGLLSLCTGILVPQPGKQ